MSIQHNGKEFKVIDYRCRPPLVSFFGLYKMRLGYIAQRPNILGNPATHGKIPEAVKNFDQPNSLDLWWKEIDDTGIDAVVVAGRYMEGQEEWSMDGAALLEYEKKYPGRFYGIAPINIDQPIPKAVEQLEADLKAGVRGVTIEPGYRMVGGPSVIDNPEFFPLYEVMQDSGKFLQVQTGAFASPVNFDLPNQIWRFDNVLRQFPKLRLVLGHGGPPVLDRRLWVVGYTAVFCTVLPFLLWSWGLKRIPATSSCVILLIEIVFALVLAAVVFGERLTPGAMFGALLIMGAVLLVARETRAGDESRS